MRYSLQHLSALYSVVLSSSRHGVYHGGGTIHPEVGVGDANANPPNFVRYKKERSVAFKIRQNPFPDWAHNTPQTPDPMSDGEGTAPYPTPLCTDPPSALAMRTPRIQPDLRMLVDQSIQLWDQSILTKIVLLCPLHWVSITVLDEILCSVAVRC